MTHTHTHTHTHIHTHITHHITSHHKPCQARQTLEAVVLTEGVAAPFLSFVVEGEEPFAAGLVERAFAAVAVGAGASWIGEVAWDLE